MPDKAKVLKRVIALTSALGIWFGTGYRAAALGPHEIVVIANAGSTASVEIAREYGQLRGVPATNIVAIDMPPAPSNHQAALATGDFTRLIWIPVTNILAQRGIAGHILAWVYSVDFPVRVTVGDQEMSLTGLTFLRGHPLPAEQIRQGTWVSPLFAGPEKPWARSYGSQSFDEQRQWLADDMPLPAMMLGVMGKNANTREEIGECLKRGSAADGTRPAGTIYFVTNNDVRTKCREWQFLPTARELANQGISAVITNDMPANSSAAIGIMRGISAFDAGCSNRYPPGFIGEHLTSMGAIFCDHGQTRLTAWLAAGATASSGTVTEPFAIWAKFPNARLFVHYIAGCTVMESFYQSVRCPVQILPVGDPLAAPWRQRAAMKLNVPESMTTGKIFEVSAGIGATPDLFYVRYQFFVDGRPASEPQAYGRFRLDTTKLTAGQHVLRCVGFTPGPVRQQVFTETAFQVK